MVLNQLNELEAAILANLPRRVNPGRDCTRVVVSRRMEDGLLKVGPGGILNLVVSARISCHGNGAGVGGERDQSRAELQHQSA